MSQAQRKRQAAKKLDNVVVSDTDGITEAAEVEVPEASVDKPVAGVWNVVKSLSDDEMQVEAANIQNKRIRVVVCRVRLDGKLTGEVFNIENAGFRADTGEIEAY